jgi:hypothetical protein
MTFDELMQECERERLELAQMLRDHDAAYGGGMSHLADFLALTNDQLRLFVTPVAGHA